MQQLFPQIMSLMKYQKNFKECFWRFDPKSIDLKPPKTGGLPELDTGLPGSSRRTGDHSFQVSGQVSKVDSKMKGSLKKKEHDYEIRIAGKGVSPEPERQSPGLSRFSPKFEEAPISSKLKQATLTDKSLSSEFMTNRETFADNSTTVTVKSGSMMGSSPKFQQPTLQMLNPELFSKSVKAKNLIKNVEFESIRNVKERQRINNNQTQLPRTSIGASAEATRGDREGTRVEEVGRNSEVAERTTQTSHSEMIQALS